ncbi:AraC family transcriptional regulator ligand-binding domain-containing protein [Streptomyces sp. V4-01]|uniref:AraC family transcriptional regulator ligand-binding domain-containing protein n=1 Tax=Actinacidiphila polyblastidii TaxID=3110430 RepID=A0ABU7P967_9ACTN|nr:AraC family transcriptional regulator ligand-binding domain-containing protein [Streptomyces sp. V4-01]
MPSAEPSPPLSPQPQAVPALTESVVIPRFIATASTSGRTEAERLVRAAGLPGALRDPETARTPSANTYRLWGAVLARTGRADAGLLAATHYRPGLLDLFDYLLRTAPTVGDGLTRAAAHIHLVSSNSVLTARESGDEFEVAYGVRHGDAELRGVVAEFALAVVTSQLRHATGTVFSPVRVSFAHRAPRRGDGHQGYAEAFGSAEIEFGAEHDALTLHRGALERPLPTADPALAGIILRAAAAVPPPRHTPDSAVPGLHSAIRAQLADGRPSLADAARRLAVSPRTLQRRLGEFGTTWREELDAVRREQSAGLRHVGAGSAQRAARLGFAESRSLRRAMNRWDAREVRPAGRAEPRAEAAEHPAGAEHAVDAS